MDIIAATATRADGIGRIGGRKRSSEQRNGFTATAHPSRVVSFRPSSDTSDTVFVESGEIRETVETGTAVTNVLASRINTG